LFNVQAFARNANNGFGEVAHVQHINDFFDDFVLFSFGD
jgi:hypothetical protein